MLVNIWSLDLGFLVFGLIWVGFVVDLIKFFFGKIYDVFLLVIFFVWYKCSIFWVVVDVDKLVIIFILVIIWMEEYIGNW